MQCDFCKKQALNHAVVKCTTQGKPDQFELDLCDQCLEESLETSLIGTGDKVTCERGSIV